MLFRRCDRRYYRYECVPSQDAEKEIFGRYTDFVRITAYFKQFHTRIFVFYAKKKPPVNKKVFHHKNTSLLPGHFYKNSCQTFFSDPYCEAEKKEPQADNTTIR